MGHLERSQTKPFWESFLPLNLFTHIYSPPNMSLQFQIIKHMLKQKCHEPESGESTNRRFRLLGTLDDKRLYQIQNIKEMCFKELNRNSIIQILAQCTILGMLLNIYVSVYLQWFSEVGVLTRSLRVWMNSLC